MCPKVWLSLNNVKPLIQIRVSMPSTVFAIFLMFGGCGVTVSDQEVNSQSSARGSAAEVSTVGLRESKPVGKVAIRESWLEKKVSQVGVFEPRENQSSVSSFIPQSIERDLRSPDARVRYRGLEYWEAKDSTAPLDPVFEAMEDQDEIVRGRATEIVERHWAVEQDREKQKLEQTRERKGRESQGD